jgi:predicted dehydrogenase
VEKVRLASVGLGRWAGVLARGAQRGEAIELVSCFSRSEERRTSFCEELGIPRSAPSYEELLADTEVEGVLVTTPNDTHKAVINQALEAGKAVYTDKPIAHTLEDAVAIAAAVTESGRIFAVGHSARRLSGHREMKRWVDEGRLGRISLAEANFSNERGLELTPQTWRYFASKSPGGALIQLGVHHADTLQYLLGPVRSVSAIVRKLYSKSEVADATMTILEFEAGMLGYLGSGWASPGVYSMNLLGTDANLFYDLDFTRWQESHTADKHSTLRRQSYGESDREAIDLPPSDMFREQLDEFALAIRGKDEVEVGAAAGIAALAVVYAALESSARGGESVELEEVVDTARVRSAT